MRWLPGLLAVLAIAACGPAGESAPSGGTQASASSGSGGPAGTSALPLTVRSTLEVRHGGDRLVEARDWTAPGAVLVQYREHVVCDGTGRFSLVPTEPVQGLTSSWPLFEMLQGMHEALLVRYRDFAVRDTAELRRNWTLSFLGIQEVVAGRTCERIDVTSRISGRRYELSVDPETGLALHQRELDAQGTLLSSVTYETYEADPDLSNVAWHQPLPTRELALDADLAAELGRDVPLPTLLPQGYELRSLEVLDLAGQDPDGPTTWLRAEYDDGVDPLFYLVGVPGGGVRGATSTSTVPPVGGSSTPTDVKALDLGCASVVTGSFPQGEVMVAGRVPYTDLLDLLESTLP